MVEGDMDPMSAPSIVNETVYIFILHILLIAARHLRLNVEERRDVILSAAPPDPTTLLLGLLDAIVNGATPLTNTFSKSDFCNLAHTLTSFAAPASSLGLAATIEGREVDEDVILTTGQRVLLLVWRRLRKGSCRWGPKFLE